MVDYEVKHEPFHRSVHNIVLGSSLDRENVVNRLTAQVEQLRKL